MTESTVIRIVIGFALFMGEFQEGVQGYVDSNYRKSEDAHDTNLFSVNMHTNGVLNHFYNCLCGNFI